MNRQEYLDQPGVQAFIIWVQQTLNPNGFEHHYHHNGMRQDFHFTDLFDAYTQYNWGGNNFNYNLASLTAFRRCLDLHIGQNNNHGVHIACTNILRWGGVINKNIDWLNQHQNELVNYFNSVREILQYIGELEIPLNNLGPIPHLRMNAGFTKIYSLIVDEFIIYDSRVSAALCFLIRRYLEENLVQGIPDHLRFAFAGGRSPANRNPRTQVYQFSILTKRNWMEHNIKASWLLYGIINHNGNPFFNLHGDINFKLRALEAALFMIGYWIPGD